MLVCPTGGGFRKSGVRGGHEPRRPDHARQRRTGAGDEPHAGAAAAAVRRRQGHAAVHAAGVDVHQDGWPAPRAGTEQAGVQHPAPGPRARPSLAPPAQAVAAQGHTGGREQAPAQELAVPPDQHQVHAGLPTGTCMVGGGDGRLGDAVVDAIQAVSANGKGPRNSGLRELSNQPVC